MLLLHGSEQWGGMEGSHLVNVGATGVSNCSQLRWDYSQVLINSCQHLSAWVAGMAMSASDRTLDVLLDHLWDLDLPTILARMADRSESYQTSSKNSAVSINVLAVDHLQQLRNHCVRRAVVIASQPVSGAFSSTWRSQGFGWLVLLSMPVKWVKLVKFYFTCRISVYRGKERVFI